MTGHAGVAGDEAVPFDRRYVEVFAHECAVGWTLRWSWVGFDDSTFGVEDSNHAAGAR